MIQDFILKNSFFEKTHVFKRIVIDKLKEQEKLLKNDKLNQHPHSWRSKAPLIYRATPQWFISMQKNDLRKKLSNQLMKQFFPKKGKDGYCL